VIAEGVETCEDVEWLTRIGCEKVQGYFFSRPVDHQTAQELLHNFQKVLSLSYQSEVSLGYC